MISSYFFYRAMYYSANWVFALRKPNITDLLQGEYPKIVAEIVC